MTHADIEQPDEDILKMTAWFDDFNLGQIVYSKKKGEFRCESGMIVIEEPPRSSPIWFTLAAEWHTVYLGKSRDGYLVMRTKGSTVGIFLGVPGADTAWHWFRFKPKHDGEPPRQCRDLRPY